MKKIISLMLVLYLFSCTDNTTEINDLNNNTNFISFNFNNTIYNGIDGLSFFGEGESFDDVNYYNKNQNRIEGATDQDFFQIIVGSFDDFSEFGIGSLVLSLTGTNYFSDTTKLSCNGNNTTVLNYELNLTRNDDVIGGLIEGNFNGTIGRPNSFPCNNCCYYISDFSGEFRLLIK